MIREFTDRDTLSGVVSVVEERHKLLDMSSERTYDALRFARARIGGAVDMARLYGGAGFVIQYHNLTRYASELLKR